LKIVNYNIVFKENMNEKDVVTYKTNKDFSIRKITKRLSILPIDTNDYNILLKNIQDMKLLNNHELLLLKTLNEEKFIEIIMIYNNIIKNMRILLYYDNI